MCSLFTFPLTHFTFSSFSHLSPLVFPLFFSSGSLFLPRLRLCLLSFFFFFILPQPGAKPGIFIWRGQVATLIYLSKQPSHTYIYTHTCAFFIIYTHTHIYTLFYLISYIHTPTQHQKKKKKKKGLSTFNQSYV